MKFRLSFGVIGLIISLFVLSSVLIPQPTEGQTRPVTVAGGYQFSVFAGPSNVPDFAASSFTGPVSIAFDRRGRLFVGTFPGKILILIDNDDNGVADEVKTFATGLTQPLGMTFRDNGDLFITSNRLISEPVQGGQGRIVRLRDLDGDDVADEITTIIDGLPSHGDHQTDRLRFGPDGMLYFGQGSATDNGIPKPARPDEGPLNATILRIDVDAPSIEVFARGLRNPFGMAFHPVNGELFTTDGGSGEICQIGPCPPDTSPPEEVNWVVRNGNYGFPRCEGTPVGSNPDCNGVRPPIQQFPAHLTPTSLAFYTGPQAGEQTNHLLLTLYKRLAGTGGDLRRLKLAGDSTSGFTVTEMQVIADFGIIDPFDGPIDTAIDTVTGDIYVARFDPVQHANPNEHHHFIYRIHRDGSDSQTFIGPIAPAVLNCVDGVPSSTTLRITGRRIQPGATVFNMTDNVALPTSASTNAFELMVQVTAGLCSSRDRTIQAGVRNPDGSMSNLQPLEIRVEDTGDPAPRLSSMFVYKKKPHKVVNPVVAGSNAKKFRLSVSGTDFDSQAQLMVNGTVLDLVDRSATEIVGKLTNQLIAAPGNLSVQVRNGSGKTSQTLTLTVIP